MSKVEQLKKQYPNLSLSFVDLAKLIDVTKSHKYTPVICKIFSEIFTIKKDNEYEERISHLLKQFVEMGVSVGNLSPQEMLIYKFLLENVHSQMDLIKDLMEYGERGLLPTKDILKYKNTEEIKRDVTLAIIKDSDKSLSEQIYKEFENETWIVLRPLTYQASIKYGASTKWCTTSKYEKEYFARYWDRGILVYFINKETGYKFAGYKGLKVADELSFWNSVDNRIDSLEIECDSYLYDIIKNIFKSDKTNSDICGFQTKMDVANECNYILSNWNNTNIEPIYDNPDFNNIIRLAVGENNTLGVQNNNLNVSDTTYLTNEAFLTTPTVAS